MGNDLIDQAVFLCLLRGKVVVALGVLLDLFQRLAGVLAEHPVHLIADIDHVLGMDLDIRGLAGKAAALLAETDVLVDGPFVESRKSLELKWCGSSNQRLIDLPATRRAGSVVEWQPASFSLEKPSNW